MEPFRLTAAHANNPGLAFSELLGRMHFPHSPGKAQALFAHLDGQTTRGVLAKAREEDATDVFERLLDRPFAVMARSLDASALPHPQALRKASRHGYIAGRILRFMAAASTNREHYSLSRARFVAVREEVQKWPSHPLVTDRTAQNAWREYACVAPVWAVFGEAHATRGFALAEPSFSMSLAQCEALRLFGERLTIQDWDGEFPLLDDSETLRIEGVRPDLLAEMSGPGDGRPPWWLGRLTDQQMTILAEYRRPKR